MYSASKRFTRRFPVKFGIAGRMIRFWMTRGAGSQICVAAMLFPQKTNIQQLKEEIREKLPEATAEGNGGTSITSGTNSTATGTLRHRKNRPAPQPPQRPSSHNGAISAPEQLEIRAPSELLFGVPSTLKTQWRHQPKALVAGCVTYVANVSAFRFYVALYISKKYFTIYFQAAITSKYQIDQIKSLKLFSKFSSRNYSIRETIRQFCLYGIVRGMKL